MTHNPTTRQRRHTTSGNATEAVEKTTLPTPPDGGWGWIVVFASFMIHIVSKYPHSYYNIINKTHFLV